MDLSICLGLRLRPHPNCFIDKITWVYTANLARDETLYEVRCHNKIEWREISEVEVLGNIQETFDSVTPSVQDMIRGKPVVTPDAIYRLKDNQK